MPATIGYRRDLKPSDADLLVRIRKQLDEGRRVRRELREQKWRRCERQYEGDHWPTSEDPTADLTIVNVSLSTLNTIVPAIAGEVPHFSVMPMSKDATETNARLQEIFLNMQWVSTQTGAESASRDAVHNCVKYGDGFLKGTYELINSPKPEAIDSTQTEVRLHIDSIDPWDVWMDPVSNSLDSARWVCHRIITTRRELDKSFYIDEAGNQQPTYKGLDDIEYGRFEFAKDDKGVALDRILVYDDGEEWTAIYEFYDRIDEVMVTFGEGGTMPLRIVEAVAPPIWQIPNYRISGRPWHMGDLEHIWYMQMEINKTRSQLITHRRRNVAKVFIREEALTDEGRQALASPIVGEFVTVHGDGPLSNIVMPMQLQPLSQDVYASSQQAIQDVYEVTGVTEYQRGAAPQITRTATEASIMEGSSNVKLRAKMNTIEECFRKAGEYILAVAKELFPQTELEEISFYVTGPDAERLNRQVIGDKAGAMVAQGDVQGAMNLAATADMYQSGTATIDEQVFTGKYSVTVDVGSTEYRNPLSRERRAKELVTTLLNFAPILTQIGVQLNWTALLRLWFDAAKIPDIDGILSPATQMQPPQMPSDAGGGAGPAIPDRGSNMPPELLAALQQGGAGPQAPMEPPTPDNSGMLASLPS